ncbi:transporter suffix domain-containing protein [Microcoleus sp. S13C4]|uniref:transporter suffix domain-containing protein n=1 Tax=Microcoleus sp. S13C4 TaxID=3055410 RepID=UPI002FD5EE9F
MLVLPPILNVLVEQAGKPVADIGAKFTPSGLRDKGDIKAVLCESMQKLGLFLFVLSFLPWLAIFFVVPFLPLDITQKTTLSVVLAVGAEVCFWISVVLLGKEVVTKYRRYLHPRYLWNKIRNFNRR